MAWRRTGFGQLHVTNWQLCEERTSDLHILARLNTTRVGANAVPEASSVAGRGMHDA